MSKQYFYRRHVLKVIDGVNTTSVRIHDGEQIVSERQMYEGNDPVVVVTVRVEQQ